jgi:fused signal recognition particle receptor
VDLAVVVSIVVVAVLIVGVFLGTRAVRGHGASRARTSTRPSSLRDRPSERRGSAGPGIGARGGTLAPEAPARGSAGAFRGEGLGAKVKALFGRRDADVWTELEDLLLRADVGPKGARDLVDRVRARYGSGTDPVALVHDEIVAILGDDEPLRLPEDRLGIVLVVGVNGSGKTTTIGKLAASLRADGKQVTLAASDTFRAAAGEQLDAWADRSGAHLVSQDRGADPSAVAFDAVKSASARGADVLIVDTAGRLHTKQPLMDELAKVKRVIEKAGGEVAETLLVLDAQTGQNGVAQARAFTDAVEVTGVVLTKTDGSAKGGVVLQVREELNVPIRFVGVGEGLDDIRPFERKAFVDRLLS